MFPIIHLRRGLKETIDEDELKADVARNFIGEGPVNTQARIDFTAKYGVAQFIMNYMTGDITIYTAAGLELWYGKGVHACTFCGKVNIKIQRKCSACKRQYYCGEECQLKHWKDHRTFCKLTPRVDWMSGVKSS